MQASHTLLQAWRVCIIAKRLTASSQQTQSMAADSLPPPRRCTVLPTVTDADTRHVTKGYVGPPCVSLRMVAKRWVKPPALVFGLVCLLQDYMP